MLLVTLAVLLALLAALLGWLYLERNNREGVQMSTYEQALDRWARIRFPRIPARAEIISVAQSTGSGTSPELFVIMRVDGQTEQTAPISKTIHEFGHEIVNTAIGVIE